MGNKLMLSCKNATALMEKQLRMKLTFSEKYRLYFHNALCDVCLQYKKQTLLIENLLKNKATQVPPPQSGAETQVLKEKIIRKINESDK